MPFAEGGDVGSQIGSALPAARLIVEPDKLLQVKAGFEDIRDRVQEFVHSKHERLTDVRPPGTDPASKGAALSLSENGKAALDAMNRYVDEISQVIDGLNKVASAYAHVEDVNAESLRQVNG